MTAEQGLFSYPGVQSWESFEGTDVSGISPSVFMLRMYPQYGIPEPDGDITLTYGGNTIVIRDAHIDRADFEEGSGGQTVSVRFLDSRWKWQFYEITGRYNIRLPNNFIDPDHEKTPQQLATLCFQAMQETNFDVSALPDDARPEIDWDHVRPAEVLAQLCDELGCRIVPRRSTGSWVIVVTGVGAELPDGGIPYNDYGAGIDPKETPDYLKIVSAPMSFQVCLELEPVGKDIDQAWKPLKDLSYRLSDWPVDSYGFGRDPKQQPDISVERVQQPDGTLISPQELAVQTVFRSFRISSKPQNVATSTDRDGNDVFYLPGFDGYVTRKQLIPINELVEAYTDSNGREFKRASLMFGEWYGDHGENLGNYNPGTRLDVQATHAGMTEERATFSLSVDPVETDKTIITTSKVMCYMVRIDNNSWFTAARMFLVCTVNVRDPKTWQLVRYEKTLRIGSGANPKFCQTIIKNDIKPWTITAYDKYGQVNPRIPLRHNRAEVEQQCDYYLDSIARTFETSASERKTYFGLYCIDLDGAIAQVTYRIGKQGADTIVSRGTEHNYDIPSYEQRRQRDGRHNTAEKMKLMTEIFDHKQKLLGTSNT